MQDEDEEHFDPALFLNQDYRDHTFTFGNMFKHPGRFKPPNLFKYQLIIDAEPHFQFSQSIAREFL